MAGTAPKGPQIHTDKHRSNSNHRSTQIDSSHRSTQIDSSHRFTQIITDEDFQQVKDMFKHKELTGEILSCAFEVHNTLGCGFLEKVYENSLIYELRSRGLKVECQKAIQMLYKGEKVGNYVADIVVEDKVILELKAAEQVTGIHRAQLLNYLKASGYEVGLILNFAKTKLEYERLVM